MAKEPKESEEQYARRRVEQSPLRFVIGHYKGNHVAPTINNLNRSEDEVVYPHRHKTLETEE